MLHTARLLAIPATMFIAGSAIAGPYDQYKPPGAPPATRIAQQTRTAQIDRTVEPTRIEQTESTQVDRQMTETKQTQQTQQVQQTQQASRTNRTTRVGGERVEGEKVAQNEVVYDNSYVPPAPSQGVVIMDSSAHTTVGQPVYQTQSRSYQQPQQRQNMFQRMMELERRKNAWLRKTFLNR